MKRQRGRGRRSGGNNNNPNRHFESNGPDVKIRGSAQQILEKYQQYARDAQSSGDRVAAENYLQHAEHYSRVLAAMQPKDKPRDEQRHASQSPDDAEETKTDEAVAATADSADAGETADNSEDRQRTRRRRTKREDREPAVTTPETEASAEGEPVTDDAAAPTPDEAPKPRRGRRRQREEVEASDDDGVMKTLARGAPPSEDQSAAPIAASTPATEAVAE
ncbi:MAG: DUF4167 domain-containing protein [Pseudomonadota bacterium]